MTSPQAKKQDGPVPESTLQKWLQSGGFADRRTIRRAIADGKFRINGKPTRDPHAPVNPGRDTVTFENRPLNLTAEKRVAFLFNKPKGVISSRQDPQGRPTVLDFFQGVKERVYPAGRLDFMSEGLMVLTNDGDLTQLIISPRYQVPKVYEAKVRGVLTVDTIKSIVSRGVFLEGRRVRALDLTTLKRIGNHHSRVRVTVIEGKKHIVRHLLRHAGHPVEELKRVAIGPFRLGNLAPGKWNRLRDDEILRFTRGVGKSRSSRGRESGPPSGDAS